MRTYLLVAFAVCAMADPLPAPFESLGKPVLKAGVMGVLVGPGPTDGSERIYVNFRQDGGKLFLVAIDPDTGASEQFKSPVGTGAWGFIVGPDNKIYLGTHEGPDASDNGQLLVFDPRQPDKQIEIVGRPSETETYLWQFCIGPDEKLYGCTYPNAKLVSYDPKSGAMEDLGRMDDEMMYSRSVAAGPDGKIYVAIGYGKANLVVYDPKTRGHKSILPDAYRGDPAQIQTSVSKGADGNVYVSATKMEVVNGDPENGEIKRAVSVTLKVQPDGTLTEEPNVPAMAANLTLKDGRVVSNVTLNGAYDLTLPDGSVAHKTFKYAGDGAGLFQVANGPPGRIYGGTFMPLEMFWYEPATGALENPGNPTDVGGEIYSFLDHHGVLYLCAYPGSFLSKYDPTKPWNYGPEAANNPRAFGRLGPGHLRPRAMVHGPNDWIYIGSFPEYGRLGGALGVWDPVQDKLVENYHPLIADQSIAALAYDATSGMLFGGTSIHGGGGTTPTQTEAKFFVFDPQQKKLVGEMVPYEKSEYIRAIAIVGRRVYGIANGDDLFAYDIDKNEIVHKSSLGVGSVLDVSLGLWKDGLLYGVANREIFRLDPETFATTVLAEYPNSIRCGFAIDDRGIYFGDKAELIRYNWK
ncbi:MAG: PQQ-like beta-propeller repeat protein [Candidatus Hydrogenedentes bacterium]|nr:PQQ-like beta-propeller repeat protein [Candidatus Hydrogenedentota bacterium]